MWKEIRKGYMVNEYCEVLSIKRNKKLRLGGMRYNKCALFVDGVKTFYNVHRLGAEAFLSNPMGFSQVNHKDGNKKNNFIGTAPDFNDGNLEWCDQKYNTEHAIKNGLAGSKFETNHNAKLSNDDVKTIRSLIGTTTNKKISEMFKVDHRTISNIKNNRSWKNL